MFHVFDSKNEFSCSKTASKKWFDLKFWVIQTWVCLTLIYLCSMPQKWLFGVKEYIVEGSNKLKPAR